MPKSKTPTVSSDPGGRDLLQRLQSPDDNVRGPAWQSTGTCDASVVPGLVGLMGAGDVESARAARRALQVLVRHAGRPGAKSERKAVAEALAKAVGEAPLPAARALLEMLSEIGDDAAVPVVAERLANAELREEARRALQRIPGRHAERALRQAWERADGDFKMALAAALSARGRAS